MSETVIVCVTVGSGEEGLAIAHALVGERLVACVNIIPKMLSVYRWKGEIHEESEHLLIMKTMSRNFESVQARVLEIHSYELPEIVAVSIDNALPAYLDWVMENSSPVGA